MIYADLRESDGGGPSWPVGALGNIRSDDKSDKNAPAAGCRRVVLSRWPRDGECGPFNYDATTGEPVPNAARTQARAREVLIAAEMRALVEDRLKARGAI